MRIDHAQQLDQLDFSKANGLIPVIAQHARTGDVLMLAFANREALERTLRERRMWYFSRSREALWLKGETSGNVQALVSLHGDCDRDSVLALVDPSGPSCHTGDWSCFRAPPTLARLAEIIADRARSSEPGSYTARLLADPNLRLKKLGEESIELAIACHSKDESGAANEAADLLYHTFVACAAAGVTLDDVLSVLDARFKS